MNNDLMTADEARQLLTTADVAARINVSTGAASQALRRCRDVERVRHGVWRAAEHLRASRDIVPDATVSESSATRIARATQARSIPRKENA